MQFPHHSLRIHLSNFLLLSLFLVTITAAQSPQSTANLSFTGLRSTDIGAPAIHGSTTPTVPTSPT